LLILIRLKLFAKTIHEGSKQWKRKFLSGICSFWQQVFLFVQLLLPETPTFVLEKKMTNMPLGEMENRDKNK
jgi:hypothetical protein